MERWLHLAELFSGRPIMPCRNEVDQLHRIYKICGSPYAEYWKKIRLPSNLKHANQMAKPQFKRKVREDYQYFSPEALSLDE